MEGGFVKVWVYRIFLIICIAITLGFILYNSTRTAEQSSKVSSAVTDKVVGVVAPEIENLEESKKVVEMREFNFLVRDLAHLLEFVALAFFVGLLAFTVKFRYGRYSIPLVVVTLGCFLFAVCDEVIQGLVDGRATQALDIAYDSLGAVIGLLIACVVDFIGLCVVKRIRD